MRSFPSPPGLLRVLLCVCISGSAAWSDSASVRRAHLYSQAKQDARLLRETLHRRWMELPTVQQREAFLDTVADRLAEHLLGRIIPPWMGTRWTFEGYLETFGGGTVACGYFVSTTLRDAGVRVDRFRLAQASPEGEARSIGIDGKHVRLFRDSLRAGLPEMASRLADGLYFVGLSNHVGYLQKSGSSIRFVHSDYVGGSVADQSVRRAPAFVGDILWVAEITGNRDLARAWLEGKKLRIHR
ncbi:MAG: hypothetical protein IPN71_22565 [Fibrobacteres bacterium]|nr:hypothetical protein [Fibrobacterota bacterium]